MSPNSSTCWTIIRGAAAGDPKKRIEFAGRYLKIVRAYLAARWRGSPLLAELDDATQEVFVECFRAGGVLDDATSDRVPNFRAFLYGVVRNVARRFESRPAPPAALPSDLGANEENLSRLFDRTWARSLMIEAAKLQRRNAEERGREALQRVELLRLRFEENLPIRTIAAQWGVPAAELHHAYAKAREEFREALITVVAFHHPGSPAEVEREAAGLLKVLS